jgi:transposase
VLAQGLTLDEAAKRIAIPMGTLATWVKAAKRGNGAVTAPDSRTVAELEAEVARLRRELAETKTERDIVKKRRRVQPVNATPMLAFSLSAGVMKPNVFLGR